MFLLEKTYKILPFIGSLAVPMVRAEAPYGTIAVGIALSCFGAFFFCRWYAKRYRKLQAERALIGMQLMRYQGENPTKEEWLYFAELGKSYQDLQKEQTSND